MSLPLARLSWLALLTLVPAIAADDDRPEKAVGVVTGLPGAIAFDEDPHQRIADAYPDAVVEHVFTATNRGPRPVTIEQALAVRGTADIVVDPTVVAPGAQLRIRVRQLLSTALGRTAFRYALITDEPGVPRYRFSLSGFVQSAYDPERPALDFGFVDRGRGGRASAEVSSREVDRLEVVSSTVSNPTVRVECRRSGVAGEGLILDAVIGPGAALGTQSGTVTLKTNVAHHSTLEVPYSAQVFGDLVPSEHPISLGLVRVSEHVSRDITLTSRSGRTFSIEAVEDLGGHLTTDAAPCAGQAPSSCWVVRLAAAFNAPTMVSGSIRVTTDLDDELVPLTYSGIVVDRDTVIRQADVDAHGTSPEAGPGDASPTGWPP
jgi:hypothetical protein